MPTSPSTNRPLLSFAHTTLTLKEKISDKESEEHEQRHHPNGHALNLFWYGLGDLLTSLLNFVGAALHTLTDNAIGRGGILNGGGGQLRAGGSRVGDGCGGLLNGLRGRLLFRLGGLGFIVGWRS